MQLKQCAALLPITLTKALSVCDGWNLGGSQLPDGLVLADSVACD